MKDFSDLKTFLLFTLAVMVSGRMTFTSFQSSALPLRSAGILKSRIRQPQSPTSFTAKHSIREESPDQQLTDWNLCNSIRQGEGAAQNIGIAAREYASKTGDAALIKSKAVSKFVDTASKAVSIFGYASHTTSKAVSKFGEAASKAVSKFGHASLITSKVVSYFVDTASQAVSKFGDASLIKSKAASKLSLWLQIAISTAVGFFIVSTLQPVSKYFVFCFLIFSASVPFIPQVLLHPFMSRVRDASLYLCMSQHDRDQVVVPSLRRCESKSKQALEADKKNEAAKEKSMRSRPLQP
jgi:hypothetical protein